MRLFPLEFAIVTATTLLMLVTILAVARRRQNYASAPSSMIAAAYGGIALASFFAVRAFGRVMEELTRTGGGIRNVTEGIWQSTQLPLTAAWTAAFVTLLTIPFVWIAARKQRAHDPQPKHSRSLPWIAGLSIAGGVAGVVLYRSAIAFVLRVTVPGGQAEIGAASIVEAVRARLFTASAASACLFVAAVALVAMSFRTPRPSTPSRAVLHAGVFALAISLAVSAMLIANLRAYSSHYRDVFLHGKALHHEASVRR